MRLLLILFTTLNLLHAQKIALLIGNSNYQHLEVLSSPSQDIPALATKLRSQAMGFQVTELYDLDEKQMKKAIKAFKHKLHQNPNAIALFYYSGHGSQAYGESYLIPIDGDTRDETDVEADGVKVESIAKKMANARTQANILFLDACRDVPTGTMGGTKGLGQVKRQPSSTLILYSTSKNKTAKDNRLFNQTVLSKLTLNMPFASLANDISYSVGQQTSGRQIPEILSTGLPEFCLNDNCNESKKIITHTLDKRAKTDYFVFKETLNAYKNKEVNLEDIRFDNYDKDKRFKKSIEGLTILITFYYVIQLKKDNLPYDEFQNFYQFKSNFKFLYSRVLFKRLGKFIVENKNLISLTDKESIYFALKDFQEYYYKFIQAKTDKNIEVLSNIRYLSKEHFYNNGFPKHRNSRYRNHINMGFIKINQDNPVNDETYYGLTLDTYYYSFWLRRYDERLINETYHFMKYFLKLLNPKQR